MQEALEGGGGGVVLGRVGKRVVVEDDMFEVFLEDVGIDLRGRDVFMPE